MRIILTGGGTAGHVNPALAIAEELLHRDPKCEILFIGREGGGENRSVESSDIEIKYLKVRGLERRITLKNFEAVKLAIKAKRRAENIMRAFRPELVMGTGGYVSWPVLRSAQALGIPTVIHESNVTPGLTAKMLSKRCEAVLVNHKESERFFPRADRVITVGNPLRRDFYSVKRDEARRTLGLSKDDVLIVSIGGSGGAQRLNEACLGVMREYSSRTPKIKHVHSAGTKYYESIKDEGFKRGSGGCKILPYIDDMPLLLCGADIAVSRCGAVTLAELALVGVASVLIPSPNVADNHQYKNARLLSDAGAAVLLTEDRLSVKTLTSALTELIVNRTKRDSLANKIRGFAVPDSACRIADILEDIARDNAYYI